MNMDKLKARIRIATGRALMQAGEHFNNETIPLTPVYKGDLQQAKRVEKISDLEIHCISGGKAKGSGVNVDKYLHAQYFGALRHLGKEKQKESLRGQPAPSSQTQTGSGEPYMYRAKYYAADKAGLLVKMESPLWYTRAKNDKAIMRRTMAVFKNFFFAGLK